MVSAPRFQDTTWPRASAAITASAAASVMDRSRISVSRRAFSAWVRSVMSLKTTTDPTTTPRSWMGALTHSTGNVAPSFRRNVISPVIERSVDRPGVRHGGTWPGISTSASSDWPSSSLTLHPVMAPAAVFANVVRPSRSTPTMPSPAEPRMSSTCATASSFNRQVIRDTMLMPTMNTPWTAAQAHGLAHAAAWLNTDWGSSTPTRP